MFTAWPLTPAAPFAQKTASERKRSCPSRGMKRFLLLLRASRGAGPGVSDFCGRGAIVPTTPSVLWAPVQARCLPHLLGRRASGRLAFACPQTREGRRCHRRGFLPRFLGSGPTESGGSEGGQQGPGFSPVNGNGRSTWLPGGHRETATRGAKGPARTWVALSECHDLYAHLSPAVPRRPVPRAKVRLCG